MKYWTSYKSHVPDMILKPKIFDNTIYTFDIETSSYLVLDGKQLSVLEYENLTEKEKKRVSYMSTMYVWQFGINDTVYYGRTFDELIKFLNRLYDNVPEPKFLFIHNFSFEFQFLKDRINFSEVLARKTHKPMTALIEEYNFTVKCSYMMSNSSLENLTKNFNLDIAKKSGDLDYLKIRHSKTPLSDKELGYCEYDCLVLYKYIKKECETYGSVKNIPTTSTGKVRRELKNLTKTNYKYKAKVRKSINTDPHIFNLLGEGFAGGYTHANRLFAGEIIPHVDSFDETSAYPYCMVAYRYPSTEFKKGNIKRVEQMSNKLAYLLVVKLKNIRTKYYNTFISLSKCRHVVGGVYDNGRIISAKEIEIVLTDIDFRLFLDTYKVESYEILESYWSLYKYLPKELIEFILDKYVSKTELKNVEGMEEVYARIKSAFNAIYGMTVTNEIRDDVIFDSGVWSERCLSNEDIIKKLDLQKKKAFLSFSYGCWVTSYARDILIRRIMELDEYMIYSDTDSIKVRLGYPKEVFEKYNESVKRRIEYVSNLLGIDISKYSPKDIKGEEHMLGLFEHEGKKYNECTYESFITQGAKKYAFIEREFDKIKNEYENKINITVAGVPKKAKVALKKLEDFTDGYIFRYEDTNKNTLFYVDNMSPFELTDYLGNKYICRDTSGICLVPTSYTLGKSLEYAKLISDDSSKRAIYKE